MAIDGPSGSGKTYTALRFAFALGKRVVAIDTEHGSMSKYQGEVVDGHTWNWRVCELKHFDPQNYTVAMQEAARLRPDVLIVDSLSHAWEGIGGALEQVANSPSKNKYTAWKDVTPKHQRMVESLLSFPAHVIVTMRSKMEHVLEEDSKGRLVPRKVGMAPIQRPGMEYEFDVVCELDWDHRILVTKTRCSAVDGARAEKPGPDFVKPIIDWLNLGSTSQPAPGGRDTAAGGVETSPPAKPEPASSAGLMADSMAPVTPPADTSGQERASAEQIDLCKGLAKKLGMPLAAFQKAIAKRGAKTTAGLNVEGAANLISALQKKLEGQEAAKAPANPRQKTMVKEGDIPY